jgi:hypothetical protein
VIVDAHTDVVLELLASDGEEPSLELILRRGRERPLERYWLPRLEAGGVGIQICPLLDAIVSTNLLRILRRAFPA